MSNRFCNWVGPNRPPSRRHMFQTPEQYKSVVEKYESDLESWKRGLVPSLTQAANTNTLTAELILRELTYDRENYPRSQEFPHNDHPTANWVFHNQDLFAQMGTDDRQRVLIALMQEKEWHGHIRQCILLHHSELLLLIDDVTVRWNVIEDGVRSTPAYEGWSWIEELAKHHDHFHLRALIMKLVKTLPPTRKDVEGNDLYATQFLARQGLSQGFSGGESWGPYEDHIDDLIDVLSVFAKRAPDVLLTYWGKVCAEIGYLTGFDDPEKKVAENIARMHYSGSGLGISPSKDELDVYHDNLNKSWQRAYGIGSTYMETVRQTMVTTLTTISSASDLNVLNLKERVQIVHQIEPSIQRTHAVIDLLHMLEKENEHVEELWNLLWEALTTTDRPDRIYRMVVMRSNSYANQLENGEYVYTQYDAGWIDDRLRADMESIGWTFQKVQYRQPKRPTRSYHKRNYDGLQVSWIDESTQKRIVVKVLPEGYNHYDLSKVESIGSRHRQGIEVLVQNPPPERSRVYESDRTVIYADVTVLRTRPYRRDY